MRSIKKYEYELRIQTIFFVIYRNSFTCFPQNMAWVENITSAPSNNLDLNSWSTFYTRALFPNWSHHICMCLVAESGKLTEKITILPHSGRGSVSCAANKGILQRWLSHRANVCSQLSRITYSRKRYQRWCQSFLIPYGLWNMS